MLKSPIKISPMKAAKTKPNATVSLETFFKKATPANDQSPTKMLDLRTATSPAKKGDFGKENHNLKNGSDKKKPAKFPIVAPRIEKDVKKTNGKKAKTLSEHPGEKETKPGSTQKSGENAAEKKKRGPKKKPSSKGDANLGAEEAKESASVEKAE